MKALKLICVFLILANTISAQSKIRQKADKLYSENNYAEAAKLYESYLTEKPNLSVKTKLAYCYRVNNKMEQAEKLYAAIVSEDKARPEAFYYYGEVLMNNGKYDAAKKWFLEYDILVPQDEKGYLMAMACDQVKNIKPFFNFVEITSYPYNSGDADDSTPVFWKNGIVFSSDRNPGVKILKQKSGFTGRDFLNLYKSEFVDDEWTEPKPFSAKLNEVNKNTGNPTFTSKGDFLYFTRNANEASKKGAYNMMLFEAESAGEGNRWKSVDILPFCSAEYNYMHPSISPDGRYLYFVSDKPRSFGGTDIWVAKKNKNGTWGRATNLGHRINTAGHEAYPFIDHKGRLFFASKGHTGFGGFDIYMSEQDVLTKEWSDPINLGRPINSPMDDISLILPKSGNKGLFASNRAGGDDDIYFFEIFKTKPAGYIQKPIASIPEKPSPEPVSQSIKEVEPKSSILIATSETSTGIDMNKTFDAEYTDIEALNKQLSKGVIPSGEAFRVQGLEYAIDEYQISEENQFYLTKLTKLLKTYVFIKIELGAHTTPSADRVNDETITRYRAEAVKAFLLESGINHNRLSIKSYGSTQPIFDCESKTCEDAEARINTRMEIIVK